MSLYQELQAYYESQGISPLDFRCRHVEDCRGLNSNFTEANQAFVGTEYEKGTLPRVLFLSLDSGENSKDPNDRTMAAVRDWEENRVVVNDLPKGRHWYRTHDLAWKVLKKFQPHLTLEQVKPYFAHTNSAKCCENNSGNREASGVLFEKCREFIPGEVAILAPDILITQGDWAKFAIASKFETLTLEEPLEPVSLNGETLNCPAHALRINDNNVIWIHTYHPKHFGEFWPQKSKCWDYWADLVFAFIRANRRTKIFPRRGW